MLLTHSEYKELATLCFVEKEVKEPTGFRLMSHRLGTESPGRAKSVRMSLMR